MSLILCIEAGTDIGSVALAEDGKLISLRESGEGRQHAQNLGVYVEEILKENDIKAEDLDAVAVGKGPGSYTGLRIATSLAKGICFGAGIPMLAVDSLQALTYVALEDFEAGILDLDDIYGATLLPMIDARRMEVYCCMFDSSARHLSEVEAHILTPDSFELQRSSRDLIIFGNGAQKSIELFCESNVKYIDVTPSARGLVRPSYDLFKAGKFEDIAYFEPFYLKDFMINTSQKKYF